MKQPEIQPVIAAIDVPTIYRAYEIIDRMSDYPKSHVGLQFRGSHLLTNGNEVIENAIKDGWNVRAGTRFSDEPDKLALDLEAYLPNGCKRSLPNAITIEPPTSSSNEPEMIRLKKSVERIKNLGVHAIGYTRPEIYHPSDKDHIGGQAYISWRRAAKLGFSGFEVVYDGIEYFYQHSRSDIDGGPPITVSKIVQSDRDLKQDALKAFGLGAASILIGKTVTTQDPRIAIDTILSAYEKI